MMFSRLPWGLHPGRRPAAVTPRGDLVYALGPRDNDENAPNLRHHCDEWLQLLLLA
jgi:hypothetical protein